MVPKQQESAILISQSHEQPWRFAFEDEKSFPRSEKNNTVREKMRPKKKKKNIWTFLLSLLVLIMFQNKCFFPFSCPTFSLWFTMFKKWKKKLERKERVRKRVHSNADFRVGEMRQEWQEKMAFFHLKNSKTKILMAYLHISYFKIYANIK